MSPWIGRFESSSALDGLTPVSTVLVPNDDDPRVRWSPLETAAAKAIASRADGCEQVRALLEICGLIQ